jgi:hypothetical protein
MERRLRAARQILAPNLNETLLFQPTRLAMNQIDSHHQAPMRLCAIMLFGAFALTLPAADPIRVPPAPKPSIPASGQYQKDAEVVQQAQEQALDQLQALKERAGDARAKAMVEAVEKEMQKALEHLSAASNSPTALSPASAAEQAAYQALLKLSAHEYQVSKRNRSQGGQQNSQQERNQRQVDELDLKQSENKYETQSQASPQQSPEQKEQLQVLSRLKELAQRQQDLNQQLKELQAALQEAKTDQEREEIRRRLKRLREQEQEMLADVDELRQRMDQPENQSRMAEARQQLDQTRSKVQQATEALDKEAVPDALASGTRAERDLQKLRDDFRKKNSNQFSDEMRQMRADARELAQKEEEIGKKLDSLSDAKRKSLSDSEEYRSLTGQLRQQKSGVTNLLENMRRVSEETETAEPLLSKQLYDTIRKSTQDEAHTVKDATEDLLRSGMLSRSMQEKLQTVDQENGGKALGVASEMLDQKLLPQASQAEQKARQGIGQLKQGVERAAESILGDDTEALRLAKRELDELSRQLDEEIAQKDPANTNAAQGGQNGRAGEQASKKNQSGRGGQQQKSSNQGQQPGQSGEQANSSEEQKGSEGQAGQNPGEQNQGEQKGAQARSEQASNQQGKGQGQNPGKGQGQQAQGQQGQGQQGQGQQGQQAQNPGEANTPGQPNQDQANQGQPNQGQPNQGQPNQGQPNQGQPNQGQGQGQGNGQGANPQPQQPGQQPGQQAASGRNPRQAGQRARGPGRGGALRDLLNQEGGAEGGAEGGGNNRQAGPLTGEDFVTWSDRLRNVEEMVDLNDVRTDVARVRERARTIRQEMRQKGQKPDWAVVRLQLAHPLAEVRDRISEELSRRQSQDALVPIDRDPVPNKFSELVRQYYEKLGTSQPHE